MKTEIGDFLAALRKSKGYTQQESAELLGVSNFTASPATRSCADSASRRRSTPQRANAYAGKRFPACLNKTA